MTIDVAAGAITDSAGNDNTASGHTVCIYTRRYQANSDIAIASMAHGSSSISGDTITLTITASEAVTGLVCTVGGQSTTMGGSGTSWTIS